MAGLQGGGRQAEPLTLCLHRVFCGLRIPPLLQSPGAFQEGEQGYLVLEVRAAGERLCWELPWGTQL